MEVFNIILFVDFLEVEDDDDVDCLEDFLEEDNGFFFFESN